MRDATAESATLTSEAVRQLEERAFNAWPALQTVLVDGWVLRFAGGHTKRANSANALSPIGRPETILTVAETLYGAQELPVIFRLTPLAGMEPDPMLDRRGFRRIDDTLVMTGPIAEASAIPPTVSIRATPDAAWREGFAAANQVSDAKRAIHDQMLASIRFPAAYALLRDGDRAIAYGLAVAERGMVGLFDIVTIPAARRRGAARALVGALLAWGRGQDATGAYLQVARSNLPAIALYESAGFREAYRYHYRIKP